MIEQYLSCPSCGEEVKSIPAYRGNSEFPDGYWNDGDSGKCHCGAEVHVWADGEQACLELSEPTSQPSKGAR